MSKAMTIKGLRYTAEGYRPWVHRCTPNQINAILEAREYYGMVGAAQRVVGRRAGMPATGDQSVHNVTWRGQKFDEA